MRRITLKQASDIRGISYDHKFNLINILRILGIKYDGGTYKLDFKQLISSIGGKVIENTDSLGRKRVYIYVGDHTII
jgi:hypothetical protein